MKQRFFKKDENIPNYIWDLTPLSDEAIFKFGTDVEIVITNRCYEISPIDEIKSNEKLIILEKCRIKKHNKNVMFLTRPRRKYKKKEKNELYRKSIMI